MWFKRTDKKFEEAARNPEKCERLIRQYRQGRALAFTFTALTLIGVLISGWWLFAHILHSIGATADGRSGSTALASFDLGKVKIVLGAIFGWSIVNGILLFQYDALLKMLLMFRALQTGESAPKRDSIIPR